MSMDFNLYGTEEQLNMFQQIIFENLGDGWKKDEENEYIETENKLVLSYISENDIEYKVYIWMNPEYFKVEAIASPTFDQKNNEINKLRRNICLCPPSEYQQLVDLKQKIEKEGNIEYIEVLDKCAEECLIPCANECGLRYER